MSRSLAATGVLVLGTCGLLADALAGGDLVEMPPVLLLAAVGGCASGAWAPPRTAAAAVGVAASALTAASQIVSPGDYPVLDDLVFFLVAIGGPAMAGAALAGRARQVRELRRLADAITVQREAEVRAARAEERTRVEVGLQRGFSEDLAAVLVRAEAAREEPEEGVRRALAEIETTARGSLDRLRDALGSLRGGPDRADPDRHPRTSTEDVAAEAPARGTNLRRLSMTDAVVGVVCALALTVETIVSSAVQGPVLVGVLVALTVGGVVGLHRTRPLVAMAGVLAWFTVMAWWLTPPTELVTTLLPLTVVAYALGAHTRGAARWIGPLLFGTGLVVLELAGPSPADDDGVVPLLIWVGLAVLAGSVTAGWSARADQLAAYVRELGRGRDVELRAAVAEQRERLAHDLHDTVAHALTVVCVQASSGQAVPDAGLREVLTTVEAVARTGLDELRDGLDGLGDPRALAVEELTAQGRRAGVHPEVSVSGPVGSLPASIRLLAARVSRESLVNAGRYAPGACVTVVLDVTDHLELDIRDSGGAASTWAQGAGTGLHALRAEVERAGGGLVWGLTPQGFRVSATLPLGEVRV